jgi:hypothetical protein
MPPDNVTHTRAVSAGRPDGNGSVGTPHPRTPAGCSAPAGPIQTLVLSFVICLSDDQIVRAHALNSP